MSTIDDKDRVARPVLAFVDRLARNGPQTLSHASRRILKRREQRGSTRRLWAHLALDGKHDMAGGWDIAASIPS